MKLIRIFQSGEVQMGLEDDEWEALSKAYDNNAEVEYLGVECEVDHEHFEANYHNIKLPCGMEIVGISGFHLR